MVPEVSGSTPLPGTKWNPWTYGNVDPFTFAKNVKSELYHLQDTFGPIWSELERDRQLEAARERPRRQRGLTLDRTIV